MDLQTTYNAEALSGDLVFDGALLAEEQGLETAILHSLFSDKRAPAAVALPFGNTGRRGWWGDLTLPNEGDEYGSLLWVLRREKQTTETLLRAEDYCRQALAWLTQDGVATSLEVAAWWERPGLLGLRITPWLDLGHPTALEFFYSLTGGGDAL